MSSLNLSKQQTISACLLLLLAHQSTGPYCRLRLQVQSRDLCSTHSPQTPVSTHATDFLARWNRPEGVLGNVFFAGSNVHNRLSSKVYDFNRRATLTLEATNDITETNSRRLLKLVLTLQRIRPSYDSVRRKGSTCILKHASHKYLSRSICSMGYTLAVVRASPHFFERFH